MAEEGWTVWRRITTGGVCFVSTMLLLVIAPLVVKEPVILRALGAEFPKGQEAGGTGVARNPSFK